MTVVPLPQETLRAIIGVQQEIVETDLTLQRVLDVVVAAAARLTGADAAVVELVEGEEMVYRAGSGAAASHVGLRLPAAHSLSGMCVREDRPLHCDDSMHDDRVDRAACQRVGARSLLVTPLRFRGTPLGVLKVYSSRAAAFDDSSAEIVQLLVGIVSATMHRVHEHELLSRRAECDPLTGLANRQQLEVAIDERIRHAQPFALVFLDLDGFKQVNDARGHTAGDEVLQAVAHRVSSCLRSDDLAARFGGDEFVVLLDGVRSADAAARPLSRVLQEITQPIDSGGDPLRVTASAGMAVFPHDASTAGELLRIADNRMYLGKRRAHEMQN